MAFRKLRDVCDLDLTCQPGGVRLGPGLWEIGHVLFGTFSVKITVVPACYLSAPVTCAKLLQICFTFGKAENEGRQKEQLGSSCPAPCVLS